jgi:hypothetical protein
MPISRFRPLITRVDSVREREVAWAVEVALEVTECRGRAPAIWLGTLIQLPPNEAKTRLPFGKDRAWSDLVMNHVNYSARLRKCSSLRSEILAADLLSMPDKAEISIDGETWTPFYELKGTKVQPAAKK